MCKEHGGFLHFLAPASKTNRTLAYPGTRVALRAAVRSTSARICNSLTCGVTHRVYETPKLSGRYAAARKSQTLKCTAVSKRMLEVASDREFDMTSHLLRTVMRPVGFVTVMLPFRFASAQDCDIVILDGRVMDPETKFAKFACLSHIMSSACQDVPPPRGKVS
jgi:hypothetical protein